MHKGVVKVVDNGLVHLGVLALEYQLHVLAQLDLHVTDNSCHLVECTGNRHHSDRHDSFLHFGVELFELPCSLLEIVKSQPLKVGVGGDHGLGYNDLAHQVQQLIELVKVNGNK